MTTFMLMLALGCVGLLRGENAPALTAAQRQSFQDIMQSAEKAATAQAAADVLKLGEIAKRIDRNLLSEKPDEAIHEKLSAELTDAVAGLVRAAIAIKLNTVRDLAKVLTPEQKRFVITELDKPGANPDLTELLKKVFSELRQ
jgi:Spy/CpxP family protein refolding chaperone